MINTEKKDTGPPVRSSVLRSTFRSAATRHTLAKCIDSRYVEAPSFPVSSPGSRDDVRHSVAVEVHGRDGHRIAAVSQDDRQPEVTLFFASTWAMSDPCGNSVDGSWLVEVTGVEL